VHCLKTSFLFNIAKYLPDRIIITKAFRMSIPHKSWKKDTENLAI
jgi:hypothetical protein